MLKVKKGETKQKPAKAPRHRAHPAKMQSSQLRPPPYNVLLPMSSLSASPLDLPDPTSLTSLRRPAARPIPPWKLGMRGIPSHLPSRAGATPVCLAPIPGPQLVEAAQLLRRMPDRPPTPSKLMRRRRRRGVTKSK